MASSVAVAAAVAAAAVVAAAAGRWSCRIPAAAVGGAAWGPSLVQVGEGDGAGQGCVEEHGAARGEAVLE